MRPIFLVTGIALLLLAGVLAFLKPWHDSAPSLEQVRPLLASLSVPFVENQGQKNPEVAYYVRTLGGTLFVTRSGSMVYDLPAVGDRRVVAESAVGRDGAQPVCGTVRSPTGVSIFHGDAGSWPDLPTYGEISLGEVSPGVELRLQARGGRVEKFFHVGPGTDPGAVRMRIEGADSLRVTPEGELLASTAGMELRFTKPVAYQDGAGGRREAVEAAYATEGPEYGFRVGPYDRSRELVIDPLTQISQSSYLGGSNADQALAMALDSSGNVYVAGYTQSADLPQTSGGAQATLANAAGTADAFVARFNAALTQNLQTTYFGGSNADQALAMALDSSGNVYIAGLTASTDLPQRSGGAQAALANAAGTNDAFVALFNAALTSNTQSTYLGGTNSEQASAMAIAPGGTVFLTGFTMSSDFPQTSGGAQAALGNAAGTGDAFVARLNAALTSNAQSTYLGGANWELASAITLASDGSVYIGGQTASTDLPQRSGGAQAALGNAAGTYDAFAALFNATLTSNTQSTYLGGSSLDVGYAITLDSSGNVYLAGRCQSTDLPQRTGGAQTTLANSAGTSDAFIARLNATLTSNTQSTYLGGSNSDWAYAMAIDSSGNLYLAGLTASTDLPQRTGAAQAALANAAGTTDAFVALLNLTLTSNTQSTYLGGTRSDQINALALNSSGNPYMAGVTASSDLPGRSGGAQATLANAPGTDDAFVAGLNGASGGAGAQALGRDGGDNLLDDLAGGRLGMPPYAGIGSCFLTTIRKRGTPP